MAFLLLVVLSQIALALPAHKGLEVKDLPQEIHIRNVKALTAAGENAEAYFSFDGKKLTFQTRTDSNHGDQIKVINLDGKVLHDVSTGKGATTCSYFLPGDNKVLFASNHLVRKKPLPPPDMSRGYVWRVDEAFDIFVRDLKTKKLTQLTKTPGYDAEATVSPDGQKIVFTSTRDGDIELYSMNIDGSDVKRLTHAPGYDGGAFFSPDSKKLVYRASRPSTKEELADYQLLLKQGLVRPTKLEIYTMNADGTGVDQLTSNGAANFAPYFDPTGKKVIFSSNTGASPRDFNLFMIDIASKKVEQITFHPEFDSFPMFSPDGKKIVFASNRFGKKPGETNIFIADWVP